MPGHACFGQNYTSIVTKYTWSGASLARPWGPSGYTWIAQESSQFTVHSSQFTVHSSQFTVHSSQLAVGSWRATRENLPRMGDRRLIKDMSRSVDRCRSDELQTADRKLRTVNKTGSGWAKGGPWQVISRIYNDREGGRNESTTRRSTK